MAGLPRQRGVWCGVWPQPASLGQVPRDPVAGEPLQRGAAEEDGAVPERHPWGQTGPVVCVWGGRTHTALPTHAQGQDPGEGAQG